MSRSTENPSNANRARLAKKAGLLCGAALSVIVAAQPAIAQSVDTCTLPEIATQPDGNFLVFSRGSRGSNGDSDDIDAGNGSTGGEINASGTHQYDSGPIQPTILITRGGNGGTGDDILFAGTAGDGGDGGDGGRIVYQACGLDELTVGVPPFPSISSPTFVAETIYATSPQAGIYVESRGGNGGTGGDVLGFAGTGGSGGTGGDGGSISLQVFGDVVINPSAAFLGSAPAILVRSIGGIGGAGGEAEGFVVDGGAGAPGGNGGLIDAFLDGRVFTFRSFSSGFVAQSIAGGGGGGSTGSGLFEGTGGTGSSGGDAGTVIVSIRQGSQILTTGQFSHGVIAQSIGGGGGASAGGWGLSAIGGSAGTGNDGGRIIVNVNGRIQTRGRTSHGVIAQSIGGGGGIGGSSVGYSAVGGAGGTGGSGAAVTVNVAGTGEIIIGGADSIGILAQSIGGGGGAGGTSSGSISVGGSGAAAGNGGSVAVQFNGQIDTAGDRGVGILAQSIGGGGGTGGTAVGNISIGGAASTGGVGGLAQVGALDGTASIITRGDSATGILVQSIGGGGGNGGAAISNGGSFNLAIGGRGGGGGNSLQSSVVYNGSIMTFGNSSDGILSQGIGGGGGNGGLAVSNSVSGLAGISLALGGAGGNGGTGGLATVSSTGIDVRTIGNDSRGVVAQSIGGGGGNGGGSIATSTVVSGALGPAVSVAVGGAGGLGGNGATAEATLAGRIVTFGDRSNGLSVQAIGGGGGNGGFSVTSAVAGSTFAAGAMNVGIGGNGGGGGIGGLVRVDTRGGLTISTTGDDAGAILAQSIGGGGGNGGFSLGLSASLAPAGALSVNANIGGSGDTGGAANEVTVLHEGGIVTFGERSAAITAQSIGGGGGNGGFSGGLSLALGGGGAAAGQVNLGGSGAGGGAGGIVMVSSNLTSDSFISTSGSNSAGILAQSIGGGGGNGGSTVGISGSVSAGASVNANVSVGGSGGLASAGNIVEVASGSGIQTLGDRSGGIVAQSIGGGGGNGGASTSVTAALSGGAAINAGINLGGSGGGGGAGSAVEVSQIGLITTRGNDSSAITAQSLGGGGGNGGSTVSVGVAGSGGASLNANVAIGGQGGAGGGSGTVDVAMTGNIATRGDRSRGILGQSIGGGGGAGGSSVSVSVGVALSGPAGAASVALGGIGGDGGISGNVLINQTGDIFTMGDDAGGILAQSIGGSGGAGGFSFAGSLAAGPSAGIAPAVSIGGAGGNGASSGAVSISHTGIVDTIGDRSAGVLAQSIGGSGGAGGFSGSLAIGAGAAGIGLGVTLGGEGGAGGESQAVSVTQFGEVITRGDDAVGIGAQSIGGNGGAGGNSLALGAAAGAGAAAVNVSLGGNGGTGGFARSVTVNSREGVATTGERSHAILAQSIGGNGGAGGFSVAMSLAAGVAAGGVSVGIGGNGADGGEAGQVTVNNNGALFTFGHDSSGILAQSLGGSGGSGGFALTGSGGIGTTAGIAASVSVAGAGGDGGRADQVRVVHESDIFTEGDRSRGIAAQSIGGDGGTGGWSGAFAIGGGGTAGIGVSVALGGAGGDGGVAGNVLVGSTADIWTEGSYAQGILAQSIGGGGGAGGFALGASVGIGGTAGVGGAVTLGGNGGNGADSGIARVSAIGDITTLGAGSAGILTQSIGGNGGAGGFSFAAGGGVGGTVGAAASVSLGGDGGAGGTATLVDIDHVGDIVTLGDDAGGIVGQSIGGNGGAGGFSAAGALTAGQNAGGASVTLGGLGGDGGTSAVFSVRDETSPANNVINQDAPVVDIANLGDISTAGERSSGIIAQSIGGSGGSGGVSVGVAVNAALSNAASLAVSIGGAGGDGGQSSNVQVTQTGDIMTLGNDAHGIIAQSIGGDGGAGGGSVGVAIGAAGQTQVSGALAIGGSGGTSAISGDVAVSHIGQAITEGQRSHGILAQSIGGSGGSGGFSVAGALAIGGQNSAALSVAIGGAGGDGGEAGTISVSREGFTQTRGDDSSGIHAQSIGGSGGAGGFSLAGALSFSGQNAAAIGVSIGGTGGAAANANTVNVANVGDMVAIGNRSHAILAQSLGGGGGNGGFSGSLAAAAATGRALSAGIGIGGTGGAGGDSLNVAVANTGNLMTEGVDSDAILAQSIGGGGGSGGSVFAMGVGIGTSSIAASVGIGGSGSGGGTAGSVSITHDGDVFTSGDRSRGLVAQSIGGGGGNGGFSATLAGGLAQNTGIVAAVGIGGTADGGGDAAEVNVSADGSVTTLGIEADGILAQSIGGGGGNGGFALAGAASFSTQDDGRAAGVAIGGGGGTASDGDLVTVSGDSDIVTLGDRARGIVAQSIGGGGGNGGWSAAIAAAGSGNAGAVGAGVSIGGFAGEGGSGSEVTVNVTGDVMTSGIDAMGILAQSIGGGGGSGGFALAGTINAGSNLISANVAVGGGGGAGGDADAVNVTSSGTIWTQGQRASGLVGQSIGGGGGNGGGSVAAGLDVGLNGNGQGYAASVSIGGSGGVAGNSSAVSVVSDGQILTEGDDANAIIAQSIGGGGGAGGFAVAAQASINTPLTGAAFALGGSGGGGGDASSVSVIANEAVATMGDRAVAILGQSIGGGGGSGGFAASIIGGLEGTSSGGSPNRTAAVTIGGAGGVGGNAGAVSVSSLSAAQTMGELSHAISAQSIGGGGGSGGAAISANLSRSTGATSIAFALGGEGGAAGNGDTVNVVADGLVTTEGDLSFGIMAQSIGGGGGDGGMAGALSFNSAGSPGSNRRPVNISLALGGGAGIGGSGGEVNVASTADIMTMGAGSHAVLAQSIGGSGGNGGMSFAGSISDSPATNIAIGLGGVGGAGNIGGNVSVTSSGNVLTLGDNAVGLLAQSIGGGGGNGGSVGTLATSVTRPGATGNSTNITMSLGGRGGSAMVPDSDNLGGAVTVTHNGTIETLGELSHGIYAESIGGGGGSGGATSLDSDLFEDYVDGTLPQGSISTGNNATNVSVSLGGDGGVGNVGGQVSVFNNGDILTRGLQANAIFAQSIGGGGGQAGLATSVAASMGITGGTASANSRTRQFSVAVGGTGGTGADGGVVEVINTASLVTLADGAMGIVAQSIGGGGGIGGDASGLATVYNRRVSQRQERRLERNNLAVSVSIGGSGGAAGDGNTVTVDNQGVIETSGAGSHAVFAQSIGGGGGNGGNVSGPLDDTLDLVDSTNRGGARSITVGIGGFGGASGNGGLLDIANSGLIFTHGDRSHGVFAQTIGGGGGNGGDGADADVEIGGGIGGAGGSTGDGGAINFVNDGTIVTEGFISHGVFLQSIGGGGGTGGAAGGPEETDPDDADLIETAGGLVTLPGGFQEAAQEPASGPNFSVGIGGQGGSSGNGGMISAINNGDIWTLADGSMGMLVQSVGGGGGVGGNAGGGALNVGGQGGAAGDGGDIVIVNDGQIVTEGNLAAGIYAQSVGGGGGIGGSVGIQNDTLPAIGSGGTREQVTAGLAAGNSLPSIAAELALVGGPYQMQSVSIAGQGGGGGNGGNIAITNNGSIFTSGTLSFGIFAQSVGGGGGMGGAGSLTPSEVAIPAAGGGGGDGGDVTVIHTGDIVTQGYGAIGIFAQSVGGGGGYAGDLSFGIGDFATPAVPLPIGAQGGDGGDVVVTSTGNIHVSGVGAVAIFAQSVGGGGGLWNGQGVLGTAGSLGLEGEAGTATWTHTGNLIATDVNGVAALFQSRGTDGNGDIIAELDGDIRGGSIFGRGIMVEGGENNLLTLFGSLAAESGLAIEATTGNDTINSHSMVFGNIDLSGEDGVVTSAGTAEAAMDAAAPSGEINIYNNLADGVLIAYDFIDLGENGVLNNAGTLGLGEMTDRRDVLLTGSLVQADTSVFITDLDFASAGQLTDLLNVTGTAAVNGEVVLQLSNAPELRAGTFSSLLINAAGGVTDNGLTLRDLPSSAVAQFGLSFAPQSVSLDYSIDFAGIGGGLNRNREAFGQYLNRVANGADNDAVQDLAASLLFVPTIDDLGMIYDTLNGTIYADNIADMSFAGESFTQLLEGCWDLSATEAVNCAWGSYEGRDLTQNGSHQNGVMRSDNERLSGGFETVLGNGWVLGFAAARDWNDGVVPQALSNGERLFAGLSLAKAFSGVRTRLFGSIGGSDQSIDRLPVYPGTVSSLQGKQDVSYLELGAGVSGLIKNEQAYLKPSLRVSYVSTSGSSAAETGDLGLNLLNENSKNELFRAVAAAEFGAMLRYNKTLVSPYIKTQVTFDSTESYVADLRFAEVASVPGYEQVRYVDQLRGELGAGLSVEFDNVRIYGEFQTHIQGLTHAEQYRVGASIRF
ncbi:hypothetical protein ACRAQ6_00630 [Erythrobacter sp. HA6-11]